MVFHLRVQWRTLPLLSSLIIIVLHLFDLSIHFQPSRPTTIWMFFWVNLTLSSSTFYYEKDRRKCEIILGGWHCGLRLFKLGCSLHMGFEHRCLAWLACCRQAPQARALPSSKPKTFKSIPDNTFICSWLHLIFLLIFIFYIQYLIIAE